MDIGAIGAIIVVIVFFIFVLALLALCIYKDSVKSALEMLTRIGVVFGVLIGGIPGYYFATEVKKEEVKKAEVEQRIAEAEKDIAVGAVNENANKAENLESLRREVNTIVQDSTNSRTGEIRISSDGAKALTDKLSTASTVIREIQQSPIEVKEETTAAEKGSVKKDDPKLPVSTPGGL